MGESLSKAKEALGKALDTLQAEDYKSVSEGELNDLAIRIQFARNALVQNERKIWLRTKAGKEILGGFGEAAERLLDHVESNSGLEEIETALADVELHAKRINEETRRREMVVT